jgi:hypothetical protein
MVRRVEMRRLRDCRNITHVDAIASPVKGKHQKKKKKDGLIQPSRGLEGVEPPTEHLPLNVMSILVALDSLQTLTWLDYEPKEEAAKVE